MYYLRRIRELGFAGLSTVIKKAVTKRKFGIENRKKALLCQAGSTWDDIIKTEQAPLFPDFLAQLINDQSLQKLLEHPRFQHALPRCLQDNNEITKQAASILDGSLRFLGATLMTQQECNWQNDTKSATTINFSHFSKIFYQDIKLPCDQKSDADYTADIKIPWERSRMQHLFVIGLAYQQACAQGDQKTATTYRNFFTNHVTDWLDKNPYLLGVNWLCPMDVAIRAVNLIWGVQFFKADPALDTVTLERIVCSLYDHLQYLENNWEQSDKPNNHYLADLIGALYSTFFFKSIPTLLAKSTKLIETLNQEFDRQILHDGTCYEGSTAYHRLITEFHLHHSLLCEVNNIQLSAQHIRREHLMLQFLADMAINDQCLITIGDDDSGKLVAGLHVHADQEMGIKRYDNFGITVAKLYDWHLTLRNSAYKSTQPSGHFHYDQLSVTLAYKDLPILVDPGSYCYTPSPYWRNQFRSYQYHNTVSLAQAATGHNPTHNDLFQLKRSTSDHTIDHTDHGTHHLLEDHAILEPFNSVIAHRSVLINQASIQLTDTCSFNAKHISSDHWKLCWSFIFHPSITITQKKAREWIICHQRTPIALFKSSLSFMKVEGYFSSSYGTRLACPRLLAFIPLSEQHQVMSFDLYQPFLAETQK